jgi:glyoxylase-like metal-dependent hydrolase (beta-lactamase superfamily II)
MEKTPMSPNRISQGRLLAAASAVCLLACTAAQAQAPTPGAQPFKVGAFQAYALHDAEFTFPNDGKMLVTAKDRDAAAKMLAAAGKPSDVINLSVDALLVKMPGHVVLFDTGLGAGGHGVLMQSLALAGVAPGDVTDVFITHAHGDHVGGLATADHKPAFPKATVRMSANEWTYLQSQAANKDLAAAIGGQVKTFEPGTPVLPGITPLAFYGHTPGHVAYRIESNGQKLLDIGDTVHSSILGLAEPGWDDGFDADKALGIKKRTESLQRLSGNHELIFAPHFPFPGVGRIAAAGGAYAWKPEVPAN